MQVLTTLKTRSQAQVATVMQKVQEQPDEVKTWGVTVGSAVVGAIAATTAANGLVAIVATLASPPVALTVGALGGGLLGWSYLRGQAGSTPAATEAEPQPIAAVATLETAPPAAVDRPEIDASPVMEVAMSTIPAIETAVEAATETGAESFAPDSTTLGAASELSDAPIPVAAELEAAPDVELTPIAPEATPMAPVVDEAIGDPQPEPVTVETVSDLAAATTPAVADDLAAINGIGPVYAGRLRAAGIQTFAQLAELTPDRIREIIGDLRSGPLVEAERWITAAQHLSTPIE